MWSEWIDGACSKTCGYGVRTRYRSCVGPYCGGRECMGIDELQVECNERPCRGMSPFYCSKSDCLHTSWHCIAVQSIAEWMGTVHMMCIATVCVSVFASVSMHGYISFVVIVQAIYTPHPGAEAVTVLHKTSPSLDCSFMMVPPPATLI